MVVTNSTFNNFVIYNQFKSATTSNSVVTENNIKASTENLEDKLNQILSDFTAQYN